MDVAYEDAVGDLSWTNPPGAIAVACAVFTCNPVFHDRGPIVDDDHDDETDDEDDPNKKVGGNLALRSIANSGACIMELHVTDASRSQLHLDGSLSGITPACVTNAVSDRVIDFVAAGCWAYDEYHVVAASELVPIKPQTLPVTIQTIPRDAKCAHEGDSCLAPEGYFGACVATRCQPRCMAPQDCEVAARLYALPGAASATGCNWDCRDLPNSQAGVCEQKPLPFVGAKP